MIREINDDLRARSLDVRLNSHAQTEAQNYILF